MVLAKKFIYCWFHDIVVEVFVPGRAEGGFREGGCHICYVARSKQINLETNGLSIPDFFWLGCLCGSQGCTRRALWKTCATFRSFSFA